VPPDQTVSNNGNLYLQHDGKQRSRLLVLGEVLWDVFENSKHLGGAALNFAAHTKRLQCEPLLISAVGHDDLGYQAIQQISELGLSTSFVQRSNRFATGTAGVRLGQDGQASFEIFRPAAYDDITISDEQLCTLAKLRPQWFYYGTLLPSRGPGKSLLHRLVDAISSATRFYDVNLRPGNDSAALVREMLALAQVVKMNEPEMEAVREFAALPSRMEDFCRAGSERYGWEAVCVTLGERGCALLTRGEYVEAGAPAIDVADTVGAGDAFGAAFLYGMNCNWRAEQIAAFANRVGAIVASRSGAIPHWSLDELPRFQFTRSQTT
jgi:fructokinase